MPEICERPVKKPRKSFKIKQAPRYCNVFYNNTATTVDTVIFILVNVFNYTIENAKNKTLEIHKATKGIVHIDSKEICEFKNEKIILLRKQINDTELKHTVELYEDGTETDE